MDIMTSRKDLKEDSERTTAVLRESNCTYIKLCDNVMVDVLKMEVYFKYFALFVHSVLFLCGVRVINADKSQIFYS